MATPEYIGLRCDHCDCDYAAGGYTCAIFSNHTEAYQAARDSGWYIAEVELCPTCAEAYAIERTSEDEATAHVIRKYVPTDYPS